MQKFTDIVVWQKAHEFTLKVYEVTKSIPTEEKYGIISQIRRAVVSIELNIAEGSKKKSNKDYARLLNISE